MTQDASAADEKTPTGPQMTQIAQIEV